MALGTSGWFTGLLETEVAQHRPVPAADPQRRRAAALAHVREVLQDSGLLYGTPERVEVGDSSGPEEQLFLAMLRTLARLALDLADILGVAGEGRSTRLAELFAAWIGQLALAELLREAGESGVPNRRLLSRLESHLERRAMSVGGNPVYGLLLHNGAAYVDTQLFTHLALDAWRRGTLARPRVLRRLGVAGQQKALLVEVLIALACAERPPGYAARRAILRQVEDLGLPKPMGPLLKHRVRAVFDERPDLDLLVRPVRSRRLRHFILEQAVLASLVEGPRSSSEPAFLRALARALRISPEALRDIEAGVAEFYAEHRSILDVFTVTAHADSLADELVGSMQRSLDKNVQALLLEARMMGELSVFLGKLAMGQSLTTEERRRMRQELLDVAKAIPALAIFAAPGGVLLLLALAKVLPFSLLPSAFQTERPEQRSPPPS